MNQRSFRSRSTRAVLAAALLASSAAADLSGAKKLEIDLSGFFPFTVGGEVFGAGTLEGEVVHALLQVRLVVNEPGEWTFSGSFVDFPMPGSVGFSSELEGWSGAGVFSTVIESDGLNGELVVPEGAGFYPWFFQWSGGAPFELPGGGIGVAPLDGVFEVLKLTLFLAPCPDGDTDLPWDTLGGAIPGTLGAPVLSATGSLCARESGTLRLENAAPNGVSTLVFGFSQLDLPLLGGLLVPSPDEFVLGLPIDADGVNELDFVWPAGATGFPFWLQHWILDPQAPFGVAASNGLRACVPDAF